MFGPCSVSLFRDTCHVTIKLRRSVSARGQDDQGVARLGVWRARGGDREQGAFGADQEQEVYGRGDLAVG